MSSKKLGFIGCGNMGGAILDGIIAGGVLNVDEMAVCDINPVVVERVKKKGVLTVSGAAELCACSEMILLCVKPNSVEGVFAETGKELEEKSLLSIVAGAESEKLKRLSNAGRILRIMPNAPAMVGEGAAVLCANNTLNDDEKDFAEDIFKSIGTVEWLPEHQIDVVTGLSGGGPAYAAMFIEALADGAVLEGLPRPTAYRLAAQTVLGASKMILDAGIHPGALKDMVCSPGGTTIEGVKALEDGGMRSSALNAVIMSSRKARSL